MAGSQAVGALDGIKVLDLSDERGIYGAKLLADLGADVVRPEPTTGDPLRERGPVISAPPNATELDSTDRSADSLWYAYFASNRRFVELDLEHPDNEADTTQQLATLVESAHIVISCSDAWATKAAQLDQALERCPELVVVDVNSLGRDGPWKNYQAPDLVAGALGGAVATTGDVDTPPLKSFGELNFMVSGAYVAIAALSAYLGRAAGGVGQRVDVSVHECIASCLEHVLMWHWYEEHLAGAQSNVLPRRGSLHWSNAYQVMNAAQGSIMVTPAPDFEKQLFWLVEEEAQADLIDPKYLQPENLPLMIVRMMEVLREWVAGKDAQALFVDAQKRHAPYGWVLPVEELAQNPQLAAREWWVNYQLPKGNVQGPGAPYRFSDTPWRMGSAGRVGEHTSEVLRDLNWQARKAQGPNAAQTSTSAETSDPARPLQGVRVLDFTHVLAGPFATRILADLGADVVKINSHSRAQATNDPEHPYYVMWNRSKRSLALNMTDPNTRPIARALAEQADVVIDNFSVGVLDRWGLGYDEVSAVNPGVVYAQMSGMGEGGPWSGYVTYAPTIHALCGLTQLTGVPGREDIGVGFSYNDHQAGLHGAVAILAALSSRLTSGKGQRVDLSQFETGVNFLGPAILDWFANGVAARPCGNTLPYDEAAPHNVYRCRVGDVPGDEWNSAGDATQIATENERWLAIACMTDAHWEALKGVMGHPAWADAPELVHAAGRVEAQELIDQQIAAWTAPQDSSELMVRCQAAGVPAGVVQTGADLLEHDPQLAHSRFARPIEGAGPGGMQTFADRLPMDFSATPCERYTPVRAVGADNAAVLADWLGMSPEAVSAAEQDGRLT